MKTGLDMMNLSLERPSKKQAVSVRLEFRRKAPGELVIWR